MSASDDTKYDGTGGVSGYNQFECKVHLMVSAKWGASAIDMYNGMFKDGLEFMTDARVETCRLYCYAKYLSTEYDGVLNATQFNASRYDETLDVEQNSDTGLMISLIRRQIKGINKKTEVSGVATWKVILKKCNKTSLCEALTDLSTNVAAEVVRYMCPNVQNTLFSVDRNRYFVIGPTLKLRYGRDDHGALAILKQRMSALEVVQTKQGGWRTYQQGDDLKVYFENLNQLRTQLRGQSTGLEPDSCKDQVIIDLAATQLGMPFRTDYLDWRQNGNLSIDEHGITVPDPLPKDLISFSKRMIAASELLNAAATPSAHTATAFVATHNAGSTTPPSCYNERNGGTCLNHQKGNCYYMHKDGNHNPDAPRSHKPRGNRSPRARGKGGRGRGRGSAKGDNNGRGGGKGRAQGESKRNHEALTQSINDRIKNAFKATIASMPSPAPAQNHGFEVFEQGGGAGASANAGAPSATHAFMANLQSQIHSALHGKKSRHAYCNIIDVSAYQNGKGGQLFDGYIGHDTCNSCPYLGDDRKNFLNLSADHDDIKSGVYYKGVGGVKNKVELAGTYVRLISVQDESTSATKTVALIIPHAYYAPDCNCRIAGSEFLCQALGWNLVQNYGATCSSSATSITGCPHAMWHRGTEDNPNRNLCWLTVRDGLTMIPVMPHTAANIHLPDQWPQLVNNQSLIAAPTRDERRLQQRSIHLLQPMPVNLVDWGDKQTLTAGAVTTSAPDRGYQGNSVDRRQSDESDETDDSTHPGAQGEGSTRVVTSFLATVPSDYHSSEVQHFDDMTCCPIPYSIDNVPFNHILVNTHNSDTRSLFRNCSTHEDGDTTCHHVVLHNITGKIHDVAFSTTGLSKKQAANLTMRRLGYPPVKVIEELSKVHRYVTYDASLQTSSDPIAEKARSRTKPYKRRDDGPKPEDITANGATCATDHFSGIKVVGIYGATGWFGVTCYRSLFMWVYCCRTRDDYPTILLKHIHNLTAQGLKLCKMVSDSAPEIIRGQVTQIAAEFDITISQSSVNGGNSGGFQEVAGGIIARKARALILLAKHLPSSTWPCAVYYACTLINIMPCVKLDNKSRYEAWYGRKPDLEGMCIKVYGCPVEYGIPKLKRIQAGGRWRELTRSGSFVGHSGVLVLVHDDETNKIVQVSRQKVFFLEGAYTSDMPPQDPRSNHDAGHPEVDAVDKTDVTDDEPTSIVQSEINLRTNHVDKFDTSVLDDLTSTAGPVFPKDGQAASTIAQLESSNVQPTTDNVGDTHPTADVTEEEQPPADHTGTRSKSNKRSANTAPIGAARRSVRLRNSASDDSTKIANFTSFLLATILAAATATLEHDIDAYKKLPTPKNFADALLAPDWRGWIGAYRSELNSWLKNQVFCKVKKGDIPNKTKVFFVMDVLKRKWRADNGLLDKLKVRAVLSGNLFVRGVHCATSTFAPCVSAVSVRLFLAICAATSTTPSSIDVETAFLHGIETHEVYAHYPVYFRMAESSLEELAKLRKQLLHATGDTLKQLRKMLNSKINPSEEFVMRMLKSGYGSPSASKAYYAKWVSVMTTIGMTTCIVDACVYYKFWPDTGDWLIALCWCDDVPFTGTESAKKWFVNNVKKHLPITYNKIMTTFLGFEIKYHENGSVSLHCGELITNIAARFSEHLPEHHRTMPAPAGYVPKPASPEEHEQAKHLPFAAVIGCLQYVCGWVRFDGLTTLSMLSQHTCNRWSLEHFAAAVHLLSYLVGTKELGNYWSMKDSIHGLMKPFAFSDADLATDPSRRSRSAIVLMIQGGPLYCKSFLQTVIQLSTCCSEIIAAAQTSIDLQGVRNLLRELGFPVKSPIMQYCDNQAAVQIMNGEASLSQATKHIEMRYLLVRQLIETGIIVLKYVDTSLNVSDILSKNLGRILFCKFRDAMLGINHHQNGHLFKH